MPASEERMNDTFSKRNVWLYHYLNSGNNSTFLNGAESARQAGYRCSSPNGFRVIGSQNLSFWKDYVDAWLDDAGLSEFALKKKLIDLLDARETKFFAFRGAVCDQREVEALETQRKALDMAMKLRGLYAADKHELSGPGGGPIDNKITIEFVSPGGIKEPEDTENTEDNEVDELSSQHDEPADIIDDIEDLLR